MRGLPLFAIASTLALCGRAAAFDQTVASPDFTVTVPNLPPIRLAPIAASDVGVSTAMAGDDGTYNVVLLVKRAGNQATSRACAGAFLRSLVARPGMPDRDSIYRAALDESTFLVLYVLASQGNRQLHAHLVSSAKATHCIDVHFSRALRDGEDEDNWRTTFSGSHIEDAHR